MATARTALRQTKAMAGTRVGNGLDILAGVDGRSWGARRYRELSGDLVTHLGGDPTAPQMALLRRAATLGSWCEQAEAEFAKGEAFDMLAYCTATNVLHRLLVSLGLERRARDVSQGALATYLAARRPEPEPASDG